MEADPLFTETVVRDFLMKNGGKVANPVLVNHFKNFLNDPVRKNANRQKFKTYVNTLASVKLQEDGNKQIVLKKKYRDDEYYFNYRELGRDEPKENATEPLTLCDASAKPMEEFESVKHVDNSVFESPLKEDQEKKTLVDHSSSDENNLTQNNVEKDNKNEAEKTENGSEKCTDKLEETKNKLQKNEMQENENDLKENKQKSHESLNESEKCYREYTEAEEDTLVSTPTPQITYSNSTPTTLTIDAIKPLHTPAADATLVFDNINTSGTTSLSSSTTSLASKNRDSVLTDSSSKLNTSISSSRNKKLTEGGSSESMSNIDHEWLVASSGSDYHKMNKILQSHPHLAHQRSFITGYNGLHWACKNGNTDVVKMLCGNFKVDPNTRTQGGYTPLHLANIHKHYDVIELLFKNYHADSSLRDYSGRLAKWYTDQTASSRTKHILNPGRQGSMLDYEQSVLRHQPHFWSPHKNGKENHTILQSPISHKPFKPHEVSSLMPPPSLPPIYRSKPQSTNNSSSAFFPSSSDNHRKGSTDGLSVGSRADDSSVDGDMTHSDSEAGKVFGGALKFASNFFSSTPSVNNESLV